MMGFVLLICLVMGGYYVMKYIRVNSIAINPNNLKTSLEQLISVMQTFIRIYFYGSIILTPISFLSGFIYGYTKAGEPENFAHLTQLWFLGIAVLAAGFFTLLMYPFIKWYTHKLYGNYVDKLKICLRELTDEIAQ
ncbi:MAG: hypothetical protein HC880_01080 [Bacteroidia bacterium]|nr:hypothetical protein [Bacteroidia bacterium]